MYKCGICKLFIDKSNFVEHKKSHENDQTKFNTIPNIKLRKLNGVWKSKTNEFKCNICSEKCYSEKNLVEHVETHDNCQTQCNHCLDYVSVSELNNHMEDLHDKHLFKCQKCNQQFKEQQHLNCHLIHCLKSSHTKSNNEKTCSACGIVFNNTLSLKNHITIGCKHYTCKYCGQFFSQRNFWLKHMDVHKKVEQYAMLKCAMLDLNTDKKSTIRESNQTEDVNDSSYNTNGRPLSSDVIERNSSDHTRLVNSNATIVSTSPHTYIPNKDIISNPGQTEILLNSTERNISDQIGLVSSNSTIVSTDPMALRPRMPSLERDTDNNMLIESEFFPMPVPYHLIRDKIFQVKEEQGTKIIAREFQEHLNFINFQTQRQQSNVDNSIIPLNSIANNYSPVLNIKQEPDSSTTPEKTNTSDEINVANRNESIVLKPSQSSMANNCLVLNIKQEKNLCTNSRERNSSDQVDSVNRYESTLANESCDLMAERNPINVTNNNIVPTVRETPYFCIRTLPNIKNGFCNGDYDQTSQDNVIFICRICKNSPSTDLHSFALHMSNHSECNMHECIVCDKTFNSVVLWASHMTYHQQQIDLNMTTVHFNYLETDSNTPDSIDSGNIKPQVSTNLRNKKFKTSSLDDSCSDTSSLNSAKKIKYQHGCSTSKKVFPSKTELQAHKTLNNISQPFSCRYCDKIFSSKGPCTNHEKSHINSNKHLLQINDNIKLEPNLIQNNISIEDNNTDSESMSFSIKHKKKNFCYLCNRKFTKRCYFTNHMAIKHKVITNTPTQFKTIDCNESIILSKNKVLTNEYENKLSIPANNNVNKMNEKKSTVCTFCNQNFAHLGALTNHMRVHSFKPYKCQYCNMQFGSKRPYIKHEKKHVLNNIVKSTPNQIKNNIVVEVNDEPQIEHCNDFELVHSPVDGNSSGTNLINIEHLWFPCDVCVEKFSTPIQLNVHRTLHSEIVPYVCKICNRSFQLKFRWNWHLKEHYKRYNANLKSKQHTNNLKSNVTKLNIESIRPRDVMKCRFCKKEYNSISQWKKHITMSKECRRHCKSNLPEFTSNKSSENNSSKSGRYRCNICNKTYSTSYNRTIHKKNVHNVVLNTTDLNNYDNNSSQKDKLMDIIQQKPLIKKRNRSNHINGTKCGICGKMYSSRANLGRHIAIIHTQTYEPVTCNVCGSTFKHKYSYREHIKSKHKQLFKHYKETHPRKKRTNRQIMSVNKNNTIKYFCKICKIKFADNISLQEHSKIHILNVYKCNDCGKQFETNVTLGNHILENHNANISTSYKNAQNSESQNASIEINNYNHNQCKICLKILKTPKYLELHMRLHTGLKPFKCDKCNVAFRFKPNLKVHQKKNSCYIP